MFMRIRGLFLLHNECIYYFQGRIVSFGEGLKMKDGVWTLYVQMIKHENSQQHIAARVDPQFLEKRIGFSTSSFKNKRKEAKKNPALKRELLAKLSRVEEEMKAPTARIRVVRTASNAHVLTEFIAN
eukprot:m.47892 g.47892  ORF g.47892 m.47892 type:complete len:127 (+) comp10806_c0_seq1:841-1221(+)